MKGIYVATFFQSLIATTISFLAKTIKFLSFFPPGKSHKSKRTGYFFIAIVNIESNPR